MGWEVKLKFFLKRVKFFWCSTECLKKVEIFKRSKVCDVQDFKDFHTVAETEVLVNFKACEVLNFSRVAKAEVRTISGVLKSGMFFRH